VTSVTSGAGVDGEATGVSLPLLLDLVIAMVHNMHFYDFFFQYSISFIRLHQPSPTYESGKPTHGGNKQQKQKNYLSTLIYLA
jgi:hypothetical protein